MNGHREECPCPACQHDEELAMAELLLGTSLDDILDHFGITA